MSSQAEFHSLPSEQVIDLGDNVVASPSSDASLPSSTAAISKTAEVAPISNIKRESKDYLLKVIKNRLLD